MTTARPVFEPDPPDTSSLEGRASRGLKIIAALNAVAIILSLVPATLPMARLWTASFNLASGLLIAILLAEARGLDRWRPWAIALARPLLAVIAVAGAAQFVEAILAGRVRIPYDVVIAVWALLRGFETSPRPALAGRSLGALGGAAGLSVVMLLSRPIFDWGGALDVREPDLRSTLSADCGTPDASGIVPATITLTYDWSWAKESPLPDGLDAIVVGWSGNDGLGRPLYLLGPTPDTEKGLTSGRYGYPSDTMAKTIAAESRGTWHWGVDLVARGYAPGHLVVTLQRAQVAPPDPQPLSIKVAYSHLGVWRQDAPTVTCSW